MRTPRAYAGAALLLAVLSPAVLTSTAHAVPGQAAPQLGQLFVDPAKGADDTPLDLLTTGGCPAPATNIVVRLLGKGFPAIGQIIVGNTDAGVSRGGAFAATPADTLRAFASQQSPPAVLSGSYRIVLSCQEALGSESLGDYVGTLSFSSPRSFTASNPAVRPTPAPVEAGPVPVPVGPGGPTGTSPTDPSAPGSTAGPAAGADTTGSGDQAAGTASSGVDDDSSLVPLLAAGLGGFALAGIVLGAGRLTRGSRRTARGAVT